MRSTTILSALSFAVAASAQAVDIGIAPKAPSPAGCTRNPSSNFTIGYMKAPSRKRGEAVFHTSSAASALECSLKDGVLYDQNSWIGSIVANRQFQFDGPPQAGAIFTGGFSVCNNGSLAIGGTTRWWYCRSGDFYNLYDMSIGGQCDEIRIVATYVDGGETNEPNKPNESTSAGASSTAQPSSTSASDGATTSSSPTATPFNSFNSTASATPSGTSSFTSSEATSTPAASAEGAPDAPPTSSNGGAVPTHLPRQALGAVVGILGAALIM